MAFSSIFASAFALPLRRTLLAFTLMTSATSPQADSPSLASYYDRHMALQGDVAYGWIARGQPARMMAGVVQVGVSDAD